MSSETPSTTVSRPTIRVQHSGSKDNEDTGNTANNTSNTSRPKGLHRNKRNPEQFSVFRAASPVTTSTGTDSHLYLALPSASKRSQGGRSLSAASLYGENGVSSGLTDEKLLIK